MSRSYSTPSFQSCKGMSYWARSEGNLCGLKAAALKKLAVLCGLPSSGTKNILSRHISKACEDLLFAEKTQSPPHHGPSHKQTVLSVDLGIRNLAISSLSPVVSNDKTFDADTTAQNAFNVPRVTLHAWSRKSVVEVIAEEAGADSNIWSPSNMADLTLGLVKDHLLTHQPTQILIERQRFRSGGMAAVQEWTLRVNTLEAMMHAVLRTLQDNGTWEGEVTSIAPARVASFWLANDEVAGKRTGPQLKKAKIDLLAMWLSQTNAVQTSSLSSSDVTLQRFLSAWKHSKRLKTTRRSKSSLDEEPSDEEPLTKLDDLADSLLQGLAWLKWEENKWTLIRHGPEALLGGE